MQWHSHNRKLYKYANNKSPKPETKQISTHMQRRKHKLKQEKKQIKEKYGELFSNGEESDKDNEK